MHTIAGQVTGLPLPWDAEIAIEGWVTPADKRPEGPFGEWTGYYSGSREPILNIDVERVYFRDDPILLGAPPGKPPHDYSYMRTVMKSAIITDSLRRTGLPGLRGRVGARGGRRPVAADRVHRAALPGPRAAGRATWPRNCPTRPT